MSSGSLYLLDANIFIEAYKRYYAFDIAPSFWRLIKQHAEAGQIISIDRILQELTAFPDQDALKVWASTEFSPWFISTDNHEVITTYREVINWAVSQSQYTDAAKAEFASVADSWLIASAKTYNCVLVTHELYDANIKRKIPIPNVCQNFNIPYMNTFEMLRCLSAKLGH